MNNIETFSAADLATLMHAHGEMRLRPESQLLDAIKAKATERVKDFEADQLANLLKAFSVLSIVQDPALVQQSFISEEGQKQESKERSSQAEHSHVRHGEDVRKIERLASFPPH